MGVLCLFLVFACLWDYRSRRIPNLLLIFMGGAGMLLRYLEGGGFGMVNYLGIAAMIMVLLYPFFQIGAIGAGDVKLLSLTAGYLPFKKVLIFLFVSMLVAAIISVVNMFRRKHFGERFKYLMSYIGDVISSGSWGLYFENESGKHRAGICLSGPVLFAILLYLGGVY